MPLLSDKITVFLFVSNEQDRIDLAIRNFFGLLAMQVIDNASQDCTVALARAAGVACTTIRNPGFIECQEVMGQVQALCPTEYLLMAYAGEYLPLSLLKKYAELAENGSCDIVRAYRYSVTAGREVPISTSPSVRYPGELRMFRRNSVSFSKTRVHQKGTPLVGSDRIVELGPSRCFSFFQFRDYDASQNEAANRRYNDIWAKQRYAGGERFRIHRCFFRTFAYFANTYIRHGAWRFGLLGFFQSAFRGIMEFQVQVRLWELEKCLLRVDIQAIHRRMRADMMSLDGIPPLDLPLPDSDVYVG